MDHDRLPVEWGRLAHLFDEINESLIDYDDQVNFLLRCRDQFCPEARSALDLGCATGQHVRRLVEHGLHAVGIDLSSPLLACASSAQRAARPKLVCGRLEALPLRETYDIVFALNFVFSFLHTNDAILAALAEIQRVLSPSGIYIMDYHYYFPPEASDAMAEPWMERCRVREQRLLMVHHPVVDWRLQLCRDRIIYRFMEGRQVVRDVESMEVRRISLPQDLVCLLQAAGFRGLAHCERFDLDGEPGKTGVIVAGR